MANSLIENLTAISSANSTDYLAVVQGTSPAKRAAFSDYTTVIRSYFSSAATGLTYSAGVFSLTSGYTIPTTASLATYFANGGNSFTAAATIGTNDAYALNFETNNTTRLTISSAGVFTFASTPSAGTDAYFLSIDSSNNILRTAVVTSGITTFNTLTATTQLLAIGTSGTAPAWSSATATHTLNIPMASTSSVTAGLLSKTDYDTFNAKASAVGFALTGTGGNGYINYIAQSSAPSTPASGFSLYANSSGYLSAKNTGGFIYTLSHASITATRTYTLPDASGTWTLGTGTANGVAYWSSANAITSSTSLTYNDTTKAYLLDGSSTAPSFTISSSAALTRSLLFKTGTTSRWGFSVTSTAESGSNAGSNFALTSYDDAGAALVSPLTILRSTGDVSVNCNLAITRSGDKLSIKGGAATDFIGTAVLVGGTVTVANTNISTSDRIIVVRSTTGGTAGHLSYTITAATSFTINSTSGTDTSTCAYIIVRQS